MPISGPRTTYRYSDVVKATAVRLVQLPGGTLRDVAESLHRSTFDDDQSPRHRQLRRLLQTPAPTLGTGIPISGRL